MGSRREGQTRRSTSGGDGGGGGDLVKDAGMKAVEVSTAHSVLSGDAIGRVDCRVRGRELTVVVVVVGV